MSDLYERLDLAIDSDPLEIVPIVRAEIAARDAEIQRLQAERDEHTARIDSAYEAFVDMAQANGGLSRSAEKLTHISRIMSSLTGHETPQRVAYNRVWAEAERFKADAKNWHDTYQQHASSVDAFLGELLELLPGAEEQGSDAYDQIPRGIEVLRAQRNDALNLIHRLTSERDAVARAVRSPELSDAEKLTEIREVFAVVEGLRDADATT